MDRCVPFIGPSGKVFDALLRTAELNREDHFVTNVFDTQCEDNDCSAWMRGPEADRALARLAGELEAVRPNVVVPLGGTALWALTGSAAIGQARGAVQTATRTLPGAKLVPTYHPALVMRQWQHFHVVVGDLLRAAREADIGPAIAWPKRRILIEPTLTDLAVYDDQIMNYADLLSADIETGWGQITCIGFAPSVEESIVVPFVDLRKPNRSYWPTAAAEAEAWNYVRRWLESPAPKLGQNYGAYDAYWLLEKRGIRTRNLLHDTRLLHHALYPELEKSLAFMGNSYANQGAWKTMRSDAKTEKRDD
jgi:uracil-DNA glycosylase family 4